MINNEAKPDLEIVAIPRNSMIQTQIFFIAEGLYIRELRFEERDERLLPWIEIFEEKNLSFTLSRGDLLIRFSSDKISFIIRGEKLSLYWSVFLDKFIALDYVSRQSFDIVIGYIKKSTALNVDSLLSQNSSFLEAESLSQRLDEFKRQAEAQDKRQQEWMRSVQIEHDKELRAMQQSLLLWRAEQIQSGHYVEDEASGQLIKVEAKPKREKKRGFFRKGLDLTKHVVKGAAGLAIEAAARTIIGGGK